MQNGYLNATSQNLVYTLIMPTSVLSLGSVELDGAGIDERLTVDTPEQIITEVGADGTAQIYYKRELITGTMKFLPNSPAVGYIETIQQYVNTFRTPIAGILVISDRNNNFKLTYNGFVITTKFTGFGMTNKLEDFTVNWTAQDCIRLGVGGIISVAGQ